MKRTIQSITEKDFENEGFEQKAFVLQNYWQKRNRKLVPGNEAGIGIKKQKMLVFYNFFSYINSKPYNFDKLAAFDDGPVFADVHAYVSRNRYMEKVKLDKKHDLNKEEFSVSMFMTEALRSETLSELTHIFDLWKNNRNKDNDLIRTSDISESDIKKVKTLYDHYDYVRKHFNLYNTEKGVIGIEKQSYDKIVKDFKEEIDQLYDEHDLLLVTIYEDQLVYG